MSIKTNLVNSVAAFSVAVTTAFTSVAFVEPAEAQTVAVPRPQSCQQADYERQRIARQDDYATQRSGRDVGSVIRNGSRRGEIDLGQIAGAIGAGVAEREVNRALRDNSHLRNLEQRCYEDTQRLREGICSGRVTQNSSGTIVNGVRVGPSVGRVTESQNCVRTDIPHPSGSNMARDLNGASAYPGQGTSPNGYYQGEAPRGAAPVYDGSRRSGSARDRMGGSQPSSVGCFMQNGVKYCPTP